VVVTFLPGNFLALFLSDSLTLLLLFILSLSSGNLLAVLFSGVASHLLILSVAFLVVDCIALLSGHIFTILLGNIIAHLVGNLLAHLLRLAVTLFLGHNRGHWLLNIMALVHWNRTADWFIRGGADFISNIVSVGNRLGTTILLGNLLTVLLGHLLTLLPRLFPALFSGFIPTFLVSIHIGTFFFSDSLALLLVYSLTRLFIPGVADLLILCIAFLLFPVLLHRLLDSMALLFRDIMALFLSFQSTLLLGHIIYLGLRDSLANLLIVGVALLFVLVVALLFILGCALLLILNVTFLLRYIHALLLRDTVYLRNLLSCTFLFIVGSGEWFLHVLALLTWFIPAFLIVHSCTAGDPTQRSSNKTQKKEYLYHY